MLHSPHDPRLHGCVAMHTQTHGAVYLKVNRTNESGFDRVAKTGKKWRAWVNIDGKQHFLKPSQKDPQEAAPRALGAQAALTKPRPPQEVPTLGFFPESGGTDFV